MNRYFQEVLDTHQLIRRWLGDARSSPEVCENLLARFSPAFSMVTPGGSLLDYAALNSFFRTQCGGRAGLEINIENMQIIAESTTGATVTYQEQQQCPGERATRRFSTAVFEWGGEGGVLWRHLHETWLP